MSDIQVSNIFASIPQDLSLEVFETIVNTPQVRIERIVSLGHTSPEQGWYDQQENEWVIVLQGAAILEFENVVSTKLVTVHPSPIDSRM